MAFDLPGIINENEFFSDHYMAEVLENDLSGVFEKWKNEKAEGKTPPSAMIDETTALWREFKECIKRTDDAEEKSTALQNFRTSLLHALGYELSQSIREIAEHICVAPLAEVKMTSGRPYLWILTTQSSEQNTPLLEQQILYEPIEEGSEQEIKIARDQLDKDIFMTDEPPRFVILMGEDSALLIDRSKWDRHCTLTFTFDEIFGERSAKPRLALVAFLHRESLCPEQSISLIDTFEENARRQAAGVSDDLKYNLRESIELLGNEVIRWHRDEKGMNVYGQDGINEAELSVQCLRYMYRLLFLFYIEARPELNYVPLKSEPYMLSYSLESLRELEQMELSDEESINGTYICDSLNILFDMIWKGYSRTNQEKICEAIEEFEIAPLKSHLFDPEKTPLLNNVHFRNCVLQKIIRCMSLTRPTRNGRSRKRISYAHLGVNQLGGVYEALLSYRGFFAREDLYEVTNDPKKDVLSSAYFVTAEELSKYPENERVMERVDGKNRLKVYPKGTFIYRMAGRDREKSASYYTPESLTRTLVKYSLEKLLDGKKADDILHLTVCEPAMGSAAFINEAVNQLAEAYLTKKQEELGERIAVDIYPAELQAVKMFIADNNAFGVDLNPVAKELAEVSLWLNTISGTYQIPMVRQSAALWQFPHWRTSSVLDKGRSRGNRLQTMDIQENTPFPLALKPQAGLCLAFFTAVCGHG